MLKKKVILAVVVFSMLSVFVFPAHAAQTKLPSMLCREQIQKVAEVLTGPGYKKIWPGRTSAMWAVTDAGEYVGFIMPVANSGTVNMIAGAIELASGLKLPREISVMVLNALLDSWARTSNEGFILIMWEDFKPCNDDDMPKPPPVIPVGINNNLIKPAPKIDDLPWAAFESMGLEVVVVTQPDTAALPEHMFFMSSVMLLAAIVILLLFYFRRNGTMQSA